MNVGPVQIFVVGFARDDFTCRILPDLRILGEGGFVKVIDILFAKKDIRGNIFAMNDDDLTAEEAARFGSIAGTLIGLSITDDEGVMETAGSGYFALAENDFGSSLKEIAEVIEKIPKDSSFAVVLIEQRWTIQLRDNIVKAGGILLAQGQVSPLSLVNIGAEIAVATKASGEEINMQNNLSQ